MPECGLFVLQEIIDSKDASVLVNQNRPPLNKGKFSPTGFCPAYELILVYTIQYLFAHGATKHLKPLWAGYFHYSSFDGSKSAKIRNIRAYSNSPYSQCNLMVQSA